MSEPKKSPPEPGDRPAEPKKPPRSLEDVQKELQSFFRDKFGEGVFTIPLGGPLGAAGPKEEPQESSGEPDEAVPLEVLKFRMTPAEVKAHLDRFVIGQDQAKQALAVAVCDHYNHVRRTLEAGASESVDYVKQNVVLLGPTGVGKTYLLRVLAQLIGVPFVKADITKFSETGYVGGDVDDLVRELVRLADGNMKLASHGIIFLDEIDKIAAAQNTMGRDPSGRGVQIGLLKLMEETEVSVRNPMDFGSQFQDFLQMRRGAAGKRTVNTKHILFVVSGAFSGLADIIEKRLSERSIGFAAQVDVAGAGRSPLVNAITRDFIDYGFEPEFVGRLPIRVALGPLTEEDLFHILTSSEGSILLQYKESFHGYGLEIAFREDALRAIARRAHAEETGARGLMTVLDACLRTFKFHLPGTSVRRLGVTEHLVADPDFVLRETLAHPDRADAEYYAALVQEFEIEFLHAHGVRLAFDSAAVQVAAAFAGEVGVPLKEHLRATFKEYADFLRKICRETGRSSLPVTPQVLSRPSEGLRHWMGE